MPEESSGSHRRRLIPAAASLVGSSGVQAATAFAANLVLVRFVAPEGFGRFAMTIATIALLFALFSLRMNTLVIRTADSALDRETRILYFSAIVHETLFVGIASIALLASTGRLSLLTATLLLAMCLRHFAGNSRSFYERRMRYVGLASVEGGSVVLAHGLSVAMVFAGYGATALYLRELVLSGLILLGLGALGGLPRLPVRWVQWREWRSIGRQTRGIWADGVLASSFRRLVVLAAGAVGGDAGAGYFFQAQRLAGVPHQALDPLVGRLSLNWFSRESERQEARRARNRILLATIVPLGVAGGMVLAWGDTLVPWLLGDGWLPVVPVLAGFVGYLILASPFETLKMYCLATKRARVLLQGRFAQYTGLLLFLGAAVLQGELEAAGVGLAVSFAYVTGFACLVAVLRLAEGRPR